MRVLRGGAWHNDATRLRSSYRNRNHAANRNNNIGFRCVLVLPPEHASRPNLENRADRIPDHRQGV
ncbi:SUMF1/EgtB/PvdO family nonheme iron enzyme [Sulfidibacter corallicola]|uniref:SUMF1/EgtB/PvdO family nonheme iron enzyme n=1 Tax=Sulfidibacter corallicola TaxID=2818388 RepID=A0A8A4TP93_SULCO|nr:SUMF1/EgtB/PvdO family nonheme iron enzyme [Sulfidibacter corallicola]